MASAKETILANLRTKHDQGVKIESQVTPADPFDDPSPARLEARFIEEARTVGVDVHTPKDLPDALDVLGALIGGEKEILGWEPDRLDVDALADWFKTNGIAVKLDPKDGVRLGVTGVEAALATTGSLILASGPGKSRSASLLPEVHVAIVARRQIMANLEAWRAGQDPTALRGVSNITIITGPSRTADIGMELVMGAHGPRQVHVILVD